MWELYDMLIDGVPKDITVVDAALGPHWAAILSSEGGVGMGMRYDVASLPSDLPADLRGMSLRLLAQSAKSWNFVDAAHGVAALNAYYNHPDRARALGIDTTRASRDNEAFLKYRAALTGQKAAVVGHFPYLENLLRPVCALSILERSPREGDFPDSACEYLLAEQDYVFITGSTLVNKTLPRLLELCRGRTAVLVGPSTPLTPALFDYGVYDLSGFVVLDPTRLFTAVRDGIEGRHFTAGTMVNFTRNN
jgi:uncharacterized protein (DUF4213/DUF364 family)